jgi:hypothetical protein
MTSVRTRLAIVGAGVISELHPQAFASMGSSGVGRLARSLGALAASPPATTKGGDLPSWASLRA